MTNRPACVFDTNSLISALLVRSSISRQAFDKGLDHYQILVSEATTDEFDDVAGREKFEPYLEESERERFEELLYREATYVTVDENITESRDPDDDKFLELAVAGGASVIVSGDDDLLQLDPFRDIRIVNPRVFVEDFQP
jgi:putative PIN family toxin of toxin-antitoxin system